MLPATVQAATSAAAELLRLDDLGVIAEGKTADLIAMPGDPFTDIEVTGKVDFVMKAGVVYKDPSPTDPRALLRASTASPDSSGRVAP